MNTETITMIVVSVFAFLVTGLFGIVAYFFVQSKNNDKEEKARVEKEQKEEREKLEANLKFQTEKLDRNIEKQTDSLNALANSVRELSYIIKTIKDHVDLKTTSVDRTLSEHWQEIELLRDSRHVMAGWITAIRLKGETQSGWKFSGDWQLPKMTDFNKGGTS